MFYSLLIFRLANGGGLGWVATLAMFAARYMKDVWGKLFGLKKWFQVILPTFHRGNSKEIYTEMTTIPLC